MICAETVHEVIVHGNLRNKNKFIVMYKLYVLFFPPWRLYNCPKDTALHTERNVTERSKKKGAEAPFLL